MAPADGCVLENAEPQSKRVFLCLLCSCATQRSCGWLVVLNTEAFPAAVLTDPPPPRALSSTGAWLTVVFTSATGGAAGVVADVSFMAASVCTQVAAAASGAGALSWTPLRPATLTPSARTRATQRTAC